MNSPKTWILVALIIGVAGGIYYNTMLNPLNNYFAFLVIFAMIGLAVTNVVLLVLNWIYEWFSKRYFNIEET